MAVEIYIIYDFGQALFNLPEWNRVLSENNRSKKK